MSDSPTEIIAAPNTTQIAKLQQARQMLAECRTVDEVKDVRDKAEAVRLYCKNAKLGLAAQNEAALLKIEAERRAGEMLAVMEKNKGAATPTRSQRGSALSELGITHNDSSRWQAMATLPDDDFASYVESCQQMERELTSAEVFRRGRRAAAGITEPEPPPAISYERCKELSDRQCRKLFEAVPADRHIDLAMHFRCIASNLETGVFDVRDDHSGPAHKSTTESRDSVRKSRPSKSGLLASIEKLESVASKSIVKLSVVELRQAVSEVRKCAESDREETPKGKSKPASAKSKTQQARDDLKDAWNRATKSDRRSFTVFALADLQPVPKPEGELQGVGVAMANEAINCLQRIPVDDGLRVRAHEMVRDWIASQSPKVRDTSTIYIDPVKRAEPEAPQQTIDMTPTDCPDGMGPADYFAAIQKGISPAVYWESIKAGKAVAE